MILRLSVSGLCPGAAESSGAVRAFLWNSEGVPKPTRAGFGGALGAVEHLWLPGAPWFLPFLDHSPSPLSKQEFPAGTGTGAGRGRNPAGPGGS